MMLLFPAVALLFGVTYALLASCCSVLFLCETNHPAFDIFLHELRHVNLTSKHHAFNSSYPAYQQSVPTLSIHETIHQSQTNCPQATSLTHSKSAQLAVAISLISISLDRSGRRQSKHGRAEAV
jgi:hypothetical protein